MSLKSLIIHASFCLSSISIIVLSHLTLVLFLFPSACFFFSSLCVSYCVSTGSFLRCFLQVCLHFCDAMMNYRCFLPELCLYSHFLFHLSDPLAPDFFSPVLWCLFISVICLLNLFFNSWKTFDQNFFPLW